MSVHRGQSFGDQLRDFRLAAGLSQADLATRAGLSRRAVSDLERGIRRTPYQDTVMRLAAALHLSGVRRDGFLAAARPQPTTTPLASPGSPRLVPSVSASTGAPPALVGRATELAAIERLLAGEGPPLLLLRGEPGIGKSRLLQEMSVWGRAAGWRVIASGCTRRSGQDPFQPFVDALLRALLPLPPAERQRELAGCGWLARLLPELLEAGTLPASRWSLPPEQERRLMFDAVRLYLANAAGRAGTLLVLDDLQWAGTDALDLLAHLARSMGEPDGAAPLRIIAAYRDTEVAPDATLTLLAADLVAEGRAALRQLRPLSPGEAEELLGALLPLGAGAGATSGDVRDATSGEERAAILRQAEGIPFYLVSLARALVGSGQDDAPVGAGGDGIPASVLRSVRTRVTQLDDGVRDLLARGAVIGRVLPVSLLAAITSRSTADVLAACESAARAGLLVAHGSDYQFTHDLIREVVLAGLSRARRRSLHGIVAEALERQPERERHAAELAYHLVEAGKSERALPYALRAGDQAEAAYAHAEAEAQYRSALRIAAESGNRGREAEAASRLATMLRRQTRFDEALALFDLAIALYHAVGDLDHELQTHGAIVALCAERGTPEEGLARATTVLASFGPGNGAGGSAATAGSDAGSGSASAGFAAFYTGLAELYFYLARYPDQLAAAQRALAEARLTGERRLLRHALQAYALAAWNCESDAEAAARRFEEVRDLADEAGDADQLLRVLSFLSGVYEFSGRLQDAWVCDQRACDLFEQFGANPVRLAMARGTRAENDYFLGDWARARELYRDAVATMHEQDPADSAPQSVYPHMWLGILEIAEGHDAHGLAHLDVAVSLAERYSLLKVLREIHGALAERDLLRGDAAAAHARLLPLLDRPGLQETSVTMWFLALVAWADLMLGQIDDAATRVAECLRRTAPGRCTFARPDARRVEAMLAMERGRWDEAAAALEEAIAVARAMPYPYAELKALYVYGLLGRAMGDAQAARLRCTDALAICDRLGEGLYRPHIEQALAACGPRDAN